MCAYKYKYTTIDDEDMATGRHGKISDFQPGIDSVEDYKERFLLYCVANDISTNRDKGEAVFLTCIGATMYNLLKNLVRPQKPQDLSLDEMLEALQKHYQPRIVVIAERYRFYKGQQREGESIAVYQSELRRLAKDCQFGDSLSTVFRDQLVCGLFSEALQQKILAEADVTLARAVEVAQAFETATQETRLLRSGPAIQPPRRPIMQQSETTHAVRKEATDVSFQRKWPAQDLKECYRCGGTGHHPANCRFKTQSCHHCKGVGHIARMCRKKWRDESTKAAAAPSATPSKQKEKPRSTHQIDQEEVGILFSLTSKGGVNVKMNIAGSDVDMEVDTEATVTVVPTGVYQYRIKSCAVITECCASAKVQWRVLRSTRRSRCSSEVWQSIRCAKNICC